ncbi:hypothetical protein D3C76_1878020 [compost metagenome]
MILGSSLDRSKFSLSMNCCTGVIMPESIMNLLPISYTWIMSGPLSDPIDALSLFKLSSYLP